MTSREQRIAAIKEELKDLGERIRLARFIREYQIAGILVFEYDDKLEELFALIDKGD